MPKKHGGRTFKQKLSKPTIWGLKTDFACFYKKNCISIIIKLPQKIMLLFFVQRISFLRIIKLICCFV